MSTTQQRARRLRFSWRGLVGVVIGAAALWAMAAPASAEIMWVNPGGTTVGATPLSVALGDFNGDGKADLAVANSRSNTVSVRLGTGTGGFTAAPDVAVRLSPRSVAVGDFNGDAKADLAVANADSNSVSVRLGDGTGGFAARPDVAVGRGPISVAVGDFNGDAKADLAVANLDAASVSVRLGDGTGGFTNAPDRFPGSLPRSVAVADFNGDGDADLAVAARGEDHVAVRLGDGTGSFTGAPNVDVGSGPWSVAVGDFDGDGDADLAVANRVSDNVSVRLGNGAGGFTAAPDVAVGEEPLSVAVGDFDGDARADIAVANTGTHNVSVRLGIGTGAFTASPNLSVGSLPASVAVGDFNGDGGPDLAVADSGSRTVSIRLVNHAPTISNMLDRTINEDSATTFNFTVGDVETAPGSLNLSATSNTPTVVPEANIVFGGTGANRTVTVNPAANGSGGSIIRVTVSDGVATAFDEFIVIVNAVNDAPTIANILDRHIPEDTSTGPIAFKVGDVETAAGDLTLSAASNTPAVVPEANIVFGGTGADRTVNILPVANRTGGSIITITVSDGTVSAIDQFIVIFDAVNDAPTIANILDRHIPEDTSTGAIAFKVGDVETPAANLTLSAASNTPAVVPEANIVFGGTGADRTVNILPVANRTGGSIITITVSDGTVSAIDQFIVIFDAVNDAPTIANILDRHIPEDTSTGAIAFKVGDVETPAANLTLSAASNTPAVVPEANIVFGGTGADRTVNILPVANRTGGSIITITVSDGVATAFDEFIVIFDAVNDAPTIANILDRHIPEDTSTGAIAFKVGDVETPAANLTLSAASNTPAVVPEANIVFGGTGADRTVNILPVANRTGGSIITITVSDGTVSAIDQFIVIFDAVNDAPTIANILDRHIPEDTSTGAIAFKVGDVETPAANLTLSAASNTPAVVPEANIVFGGTGADRTVNILPVANRTGGSIITITVSDGTVSAIDQFIVIFDAVNDAPTIANILDRHIPEDTSTGAIAFKVGDVETAAGDLTLSAASNTPAVVPEANIVFGGTGADRTVNILPVANRTGGSIITITVSDGTVSAIDQFIVIFDAVNDAPTITNIGDSSTPADTSTAAIAFTVGDVETAAGALILSATSSDTALVPEAGVVFGGSGADRTVTVTPTAGQSGTTTIGVTVSDGTLTATDDFVLTVYVGNAPPTVSAIAGQSTFSNVAVDGVAFSVGDVETASESLGVSATSSDSAVVADAGIVLGGAGPDRSLGATPVAGASGTTTITVTVTDADGATASTSFVLTVVADTTPVLCKITFVGGTPKRVAVTATDAGSGLASIDVTTAVNIVVPVTITPSDWPVGTTSPVVITAIKADQTKPAQVAYVVSDRSGNRSSCDPVFLDVDREAGKPVIITVPGVPEAEHLVTVTNASPGITTLKIEVNGVGFETVTLTDGEVVRIDVAQAMRPGDDNTFRFTTTGKPGGTAGVLIHD